MFISIYMNHPPLFCAAIFTIYDNLRYLAREDSIINVSECDMPSMSFRSFPKRILLSSHNESTIIFKKKIKTPCGIPRAGHRWYLLDLSHLIYLTSFLEV